MDSVYTVVVDSDYQSICNDMLHKWVLFSTYNILQSLVNNESILNEQFIDGMSYLTLGIMMYWLVVRKLIRFLPPI